MIHRLIAFAFLVGTLFTPPAFALEKQFDAGFTATWFKDDNSGKGTQLAFPFRAGIDHGGFKARLLNAFVYTSIDPDQGDSVSLSRFLDTKINLSYEIVGRDPADLLMGCGFNLPTGYTDFDIDELALVSLPPDLLPITALGEGFNINPYLCVSKEWKQLAAGFGMGYQLRGKYDYSEVITELDPGYVMTITGEATYSFSDVLQSRLFCEYAIYGKDKVDGEDYYKEGALTALGLGAVYTMPSWRLDAGLRGIFRAKGKYYSAASTPINDEKTYGDEWQADLKHTCFLNSSTAAISHLGFLTISENGFEKGSPYYSGGRQKLTLGGGTEKALSKSAKAVFDLSLFTMKDKENWYHPGEDISYKGFILSAGLNMVF